MEIKWTEANRIRAAYANTDEEKRALADDIGSTVGAVTLYGSRQRVKMGISRAPRKWTAAENKALLAAETNDEVRKVARKLGVDEEKAVIRRYNLRYERGVSQPWHAWTEEESAALDGLDTAQQVQVWAIERGLSPTTARNRWYQRRANYRH